jgi:hypothetical protein
MFFMTKDALSIDPLFYARIDFEAGSFPNFMVSRDFDNDHDLDLVVTNMSLSGTDSFSVLLNSGDGAFSLPVSYGVISVWTFNPVIAPDLDDDQDYDLVISNNIHMGYGKISVSFNNGDGTFQDAVYYDVGEQPVSTKAIDLDSDGDLDLAVANRDSDSVSIFINYGDGSFQDARTYYVMHTIVSQTAVDLNGDSYIDLAYCGGSGVSVLLNHGEGTFPQPVFYAAGHYPFLILADDIDNDIDPDLVICNNNSHDVSILKNNGDGTFHNTVNYPAGQGPRYFTLSDLNNDSSLDIAVANDHSDNVSILTATVRFKTRCTPPGPSL